MADEKRYYWLKLKRDFFKRHDIKIVEAMPNGKDYVLFYLKLLLESIDHEGELRFSETIPYDETMLSVITNTNIDVVRSAMKIFMKLNMMEVTDDQTIYLEEAAKMLGCEGWSAERVRKHRKEQKLLTSALHCNDDVTKCNLEIEKELEIDKEIELKINKPQVDTICAEQISCFTQKQEATFELLLVTGNSYSVYQYNIDKWQGLYPAVDVPQEIRKMIGWLEGHPKNRKTPSGIVGFITNWLARAQDKARAYVTETHEPTVRNGGCNLNDRG